MKINGVEGLSVGQVQAEVARGGKFVIYSYCISILIMTFRRQSAVFYIRPGKSSVIDGLEYSLLSFLLGWWGIPWGPIYTIGAIITNFGGGKNVTQAIMASMNSARPVRVATPAPVFPRTPGI